MTTKGKPVSGDLIRFMDSDLARTLLLGAMAAATAAVLYFGWESSPLSGAVQPRQHAESKAKEELDRRFHEGVTMLHAKQYEHALTAFHRVLQLNPNMPEAHVNAGYALLGMRDYKTAADFFDAATTLRPNQLNAYYGLGEALQAMGDKQGALQAMETYMHRSSADDPFRRKAEAAVWELRAELEKEKPVPSPEGSPVSGGKAREGRR
jgi:tetratricopeptide (TPR) repeat protein